MTDSPDVKAERLREVEELLDLAEEITDRVEQLRMTLARSRAELMLTGVILYAVIAVTAYTLFTWSPFLDSPFLQVIFFAVSSLVLVAGMTFILVRRRTSVRTRRMLEVEARIVSDLLTMIFSLTKDRDFAPSPVKQAVIQMRLRRLQHSPDTTP